MAPSLDKSHPDALSERVEALKARMPGGIFERQTFGAVVRVSVVEVLGKNAAGDPIHGDRIGALGATTEEAVAALEAKLGVTDDA